MSVSGETLESLRDRFLAGEIDRDEFLDRVSDVDTTEGRDELWARWAEQGLFDGPIEQDGYTSFAGNRVEEVDRDGQRQE